MMRYDPYYVVERPPEVGEKAWVLNWSGTARVEDVLHSICRAVPERLDPMSDYLEIPPYLPSGWVVFV